MNEKLLQYIWNNRKFSNINFCSSNGEIIEILDFGELNNNAGPDFLFAKIKINDTILIGSIELHVKSSDWYLHRHLISDLYTNIILHVVYIDDVEIPELSKRNIPTLELKNFIDKALIDKYFNIMESNSFIPCEKILDVLKIPSGYYEKLLIEKLETKSIEYQNNLNINKNNFESLLFQQLSYSFGLKVNAEIFLQLSSSIDYKIINKIRQNSTQIEALFYGFCGLLENINENNDNEVKLWKREFDFLQSKFNLPKIRIYPKFSRLRPVNFPTIRISQLANLYSKYQNLFSILIQNKDYFQIRELLSNISASKYWENHYILGKTSKSSSKKKLSKNFIDLLFINCILPFQYFFHKQNMKTFPNFVLDQYSKLSAESNIITKVWGNMDMKFENALQTQALIYQYKNYCKIKNCLNCRMELDLLKNV